MKKIKDMYMWELEEIVDSVNTDIRYTGSKLYIDKPHHEILFDCNIFDDSEYDAYWSVDICELTKNELIADIGECYEWFHKAYTDKRSVGNRKKE